MEMNPQKLGTYSASHNHFPFSEENVSGGWLDILSGC